MTIVRRFISWLWAWRRLWTVTALVVAVGLWLAWLWLPAWAGADAAARLPTAGRWPVYLDRQGRILRLFPDGYGEFGLNMAITDVPSAMREALLAAEDSRFYEHCGFDWRAITRAAWQNLRYRRVVSGASTITQQVVRLLEPRPRTLWGKVRELFAAVHLERIYGKDAILEAYVNLVPMGHNIRGLRLAALVYFGRSLVGLDIAEMAALAAIPRSPGRLGPGRVRGRERLQAARNRVLLRLEELKVLTPAAAIVARARPLVVRPRQIPQAAPHFTDWLGTTRPPPVGAATTTLDLEVQATVETVLAGHRARLARRGASQAAVMVINARTREILAMAGSMHYGPAGMGYVNGCLARRSAGSVLKPFLYALALDQGYTAAGPIPDTRQSFATPHGDYLPYNADRRSYGPVSLRTALGNSLNIAAVRMLQAVGQKKFYDVLTRLSLVHATDRPFDHYGLGLAIGNLEISLFDLASAYAALHGGGWWQPLVALPGEQQPGRRIGLSAAACWIIQSVLSDPTARLLTFGNPRYFAFGGALPIKTGTSNRYRDAWIVAVGSRLIVAVWVGNFDGRSSGSLAGSSACGPILHELIEQLVPPPELTLPPRPVDVETVEVCGVSGDLPTPACPRLTREYFMRGTVSRDRCPVHRQRHLPMGTSVADNGLVDADVVHEIPAAYADWVYARQFTMPGDVYRLGASMSALMVAPADLRSDGSRRPGSVWIVPRSTASGPLLLAQSAAGTAPGGLADSDPAVAADLADGLAFGAPGPPELRLVGESPHPWDTPTRPSWGSPGASGTHGASVPLGRRSLRLLAQVAPIMTLAAMHWREPVATVGDEDTAIGAAVSLNLGSVRVGASGPTPARSPSHRLWVQDAPDVNASTGMGRVNIVSPHDGDHIVIAPGMPNRVILRAIPDHDLAEIMWLIDGVELARTPPPYQVIWEPVAGRHRITALGPAQEAEEVRITVE